MFNRRLLVEPGGHLDPRCQQKKLCCGEDIRKQHFI